VAAVAAGVVTVDDGDLFPGQPVELAGLTALVVLDREEVVGAAFAQVGGVGVLGVESIGGDDRPGEVGIVDLVGQGLELGDFVRLRPDLTRGRSDAVAVADRGDTKTRLPSGRLAPRRHLPSTAIAWRLRRTGSARAAAWWARRCSRSGPPSGISGAGDARSSGSRDVR